MFQIPKTTYFDFLKFYTAFKVYQEILRISKIEKVSTLFDFFKFHISFKVLQENFNNFKGKMTFLKNCSKLPVFKIQNILKLSLFKLSNFIQITQT